MLKSLFDLALAAVCRRRSIFEVFAYLPHPCKQRILEFLTSHDQISSAECSRLLANPAFGCNLTEVSFYLSDEVDDRVLCALALPAPVLRRIALVECTRVSDVGVRAVTRDQMSLQLLELRNLRSLTSEALREIASPQLMAVDLSGCTGVSSEGIFYLVNQNPAIRCLYLNHCRSLDDRALAEIATCVGEQLHILELDFLRNMSDPAACIQRLSARCPNLSQLSLCNFFDSTDSVSDDEEPEAMRIEGRMLDYLDLCGNYFQSLPDLPPTVRILRLSVSGNEDLAVLSGRLSRLSLLENIHLEVIAAGDDSTSVDNANNFLRDLLALYGRFVTRLHVCVNELRDDALALVTRNLPFLCHLSLDVRHVNTYYLHRFFADGRNSAGSRLESLRLRKLRVSYRLLFAIGRNAVSLTDLEATHMSAVDDRFLRLLGENCRDLQCVNFNGCKWVTDKGLVALANNGSLREVRIRGTSCSDKSIYHLAQFCPLLEWIAHADFSGKPKISDKALTCLRNSCIQRVIC